MILPLEPDGPIAALDINVLLRLGVLDGDALLFSPYSERLADVFGAVVYPDRARFSAPVDDEVQTAKYPFCGQREVHLDPQPFSVEAVQYIYTPTQNSFTGYLTGMTEKVLALR